MRDGTFLTGSRGYFFTGLCCQAQVYFPSPQKYLLNHVMMFRRHGSAGEKSLRTCRIIQDLPKTFRSGAHAVFYTIAEGLEKILVTRDPLIPPRRLRAQFCTTVGVDRYRHAGEIFLKIFREYGDLKPEEQVLEIGSGCGRVSLPLTRYLSSKGSYEGLEIQKNGFQWCREHISPLYPRFRYTFSDVYNKDYNPSGTLIAAEYRLPYNDAGFDFVCMVSVFTHMLPGDIEHYLAEVARVLKPGGRCLTTFFLWNEEAKRLHNGGKSQLLFCHDPGRYLTIDPEIPERAVAYREEDVVDLFERTGFILKGTPLYGSWCGRTGTVTGQDIIIAYKPRATSP